MSDQSYIKAADGFQFCASRKLDVTAIEDDDMFDALLLRASEMIDAHCQFRGQKHHQAQPRQWPRVNAIDDDGHDITMIPQPVIQAVVQLALLLASDEAEAARALGLAGRIQAEKIGDIEVRYRHDARKPAALLAGLVPYLRNNQAIRITRS